MSCQAMAGGGNSSEVLQLYEGIFGLGDATGLAAPTAATFTPNHASAVERMAWAQIHGFTWADHSILKAGKHKRSEEPPVCDCHWDRPQNSAMMYECAETPGCTNRQLQDLAKNPQSGVALEVFDTGGGKGWGVRALRDLQAGELITEYVGRVLDNRQLAKKIKGHNSCKRYLLRAGDVVIDASEHGNTARFVNHSCAPTAMIQLWQIAAQDGLSLRTSVGIFAKDLIKTGTEVTYDYKFEAFEDSIQTRCLCGAPNCRLFLNRNSLKTL